MPNPPDRQSEESEDKLMSGSGDKRPIVPHAESSHAHHIHEFGEVDRIVHVVQSETSAVEEEHPVIPVSDQSPYAIHQRWRRLWQRLFHERHLMQYFYQSTLYRTVGIRKVSTEELFFDLVIVAAIAALGHELRASEITWSSVEKFILLFSAVYNSWRHVVILWNLWGIQQDLLEKLGIYITFFAITGIVLGAHNAFDDLARPYVAVSAFVAAAIPGIGGLRWSFKERLLKNPANRVNELLLNDLFTVISIVPYLIAACVKSSRTTRILYWVAFGLQSAGIMTPYQIYRYLHRHIPDFTRMAVNIELMVEKYEILTMIVLGETMIGLLFESGVALTQEGVRVGFMYLSALASTAILYSLQTLYIQVDSPIQKGGTHAIRHNVWAGFAWGLLHTPYHLFLILFSTGLAISFRDVAVLPKAEAAIRALVRADGDSATAAAGAAQFTRSARWIFSVGWGGSVICSALMGAMHKPGPRAATKRHRIAIRCVLAVGFMVGMPFSDFSAAWFQGVLALLTVAMALTEFVFVQMDRIGFFKSERLFSSTDSGGKPGRQREFFDDSASESSEMDPGLGTEVAKAPPEHPGEIDLERGERGESTDTNVMALKERLCRGHSTRLIPVEPKEKKKPVKPKEEKGKRQNEGFG